MRWFIVVLMDNTFEWIQNQPLSTPRQTYQCFLLHTLHHHEVDLLRLAAAVVEGFLDSDHQLVSDTLTHHPVQKKHWRLERYMLHTSFREKLSGCVDLWRERLQSAASWRDVSQL